MAGQRDIDLDGVVFDLDDTLTDHSGLEAEIWDEIAKVILAGMPHVDRDELRERYDANLEPLYAKFLAEEIDMQAYQRARLDDAVAPWGAPEREVVDGYLALKQRLMDEVRPAPGAERVIAAVRRAGLRVGVLTNGPVDLQRAKLRRIGLEAAIDRMLTSAELGVAKPDPRAFEAVASALDATPGKLAMVGDSPENDIEGAIGAGFRMAILVERGRPRVRALPPGATEVRGVTDVPGALGIG